MKGVSLLHHIEALLAERLRRHEQRFDAQQETMKQHFAALREALQLKNSADEKALELAREIQKYKDEKANELREQINRERLLYASKLDLQAAVEKMDITLAHIMKELALAQGRSSGLSSGWGILLGVIGIIATLVTIFVAISS